MEYKPRRKVIAAAGALCRMINSSTLRALIAKRRFTVEQRDFSSII
jgi:hypothetical protein